ncbi:MAG: FliI/YscN family ATPase, partial [Planctomycetota bacterium]|nr:FliI/YscN family ATPase [Planctomycetota bacterium]
MPFFETYRRILQNTQPVGVAGRVTAARGLTVGVADFPVPMGTGCVIGRGPRGVEARVVGFAPGQTLVMPLGQTAGICSGDTVRCTFTSPTVSVGRDMLGRVLDGRGRPADGGPAVQCDTHMPIWPGPIDPMHRRRITDPLPVGVRAIDSLLTVGRGQRMGIFSASGVGKSVLMGMISRFTRADVCVIALIGDRGREVREFVARELGPEGLARSVVVASTGDESPLMRVEAAGVATAVAEYFRDRGADVLLLRDSVTRLATAQRQVGLAAGEPPATKGFPPSVFSLLPELMERCGRTNEGSITGFYTVLVEAEDPTDPVCEAVRAVTDGHIWLSRALAARGHYPAVDAMQSVSRVMRDIV